jgi:hypothetical protein
MATVVTVRASKSCQPGGEQMQFARVNVARHNSCQQSRLAASGSHAFRINGASHFDADSSLDHLDYGKSIDVDADRRHRNRRWNVSHRDLLYINLRLLADLIGGIEVFSGHFPQRQLSRQRDADYIQSEQLNRSGRIDNSKSQVSCAVTGGRRLRR